VAHVIDPGQPALVDDELINAKGDDGLQGSGGNALQRLAITQAHVQGATYVHDEASLRPIKPECLNC
jgi:hypothetical protein